MIGPVVDIAFEGEGELPQILNAIEIKDPGTATGHAIDIVAEVAQHLGERAGARDRDAAHRRHRARHGGRWTAASRSRCRSGPPRSGRMLNVLGEPVDTLGPVDAEGALVDPPRRAAVRGAGDLDRDVRDRHQGGRPARALHPRRQDRPLRRRRRRQDRADPGADQQRRDPGRRLLGVRRRRRAHPRGQRPAARDGRVARRRLRREVQRALGEDRRSST